MLAAIVLTNSALAAPVNLADLPISSARGAPPTLMLSLSVEWPTGLVAAYNDNPRSEAGFECPGRMSEAGINNLGVCYFDSRTYLGYFDPQKCYEYDATGAYFRPERVAHGPNRHECSSNTWSGNYLNWATMQAIDTFRYTLTGGDRVVDTATRTVLEKARHTGTGGHGQFPIKRVADSDTTVAGTVIPRVDPAKVTPFRAERLYLRVTRGTQEIVGPVGAYVGPLLQVSNAANFGDVGSAADNGDLGAVGNGNGNTDPVWRRTFNVRVQVCDPSAPGGIEAICSRYGSSSKPTGLIQQNAHRIRFGVFGYLLDSNRSRAGGVLRARAKEVGPQTINPIGATAPNPRAEWSESTGVLFTNPDPADAAASNVAQSGVINYLNKFGKASGYKSFDPISELYYETLRYFKNLGPTPEYTAGMTDAMKDGFPVITNWDDPLAYSCQRQSIAMIADVNAWCDARLPGTSLGDSAVCGAGAASAPSNADSAVNVTALTERVGSLEGAASLGGHAGLGSIYALPGSGRRNTWYLAGLAHYANTTNLRPDRTTGAERSTVETFMIDVAETGSWAAGGKNQMWLAAKYGGFVDLNRDGVPANPATWDRNGDGTPDNYFVAHRPDRIQQSLAAVFDAILARPQAASGASILAPRLVGDDSLYQVEYQSGIWIGNVHGKRLDVDANGEPTLTTVWDARSKLGAKAAGTGWDRNRLIATWDGSRGVPFRLADIGSARRGSLGASAADQARVLDYLRGDRSTEGARSRTRVALLGDIVGSEAVPVGAPDSRLSETENPGYAAFAVARAARPKVVYVGANDGMLHAFDGDTSGSSNGGDERFAFIPGALFAGPSAPPQPQLDGLAALASPDYAARHRFFVDQTPVVGDVDFARAGVAPASVAAGTSDWRTILVGGLGKGGRGFYALDITDPASITSESALATKVLWEFSDPDMGFSFGRPLVTKLRKYGWVVIVSSGYGNLRGPAAGQGFLYVLNARTGQLLERISTGAGSAAAEAGFAQFTGFARTYADGLTDQVYGGDLVGNVWRFDLSQSAGGGRFPAPLSIATLTDPNGVAQQVTAAPQIEVSANGIDRTVFVGTGRLLDLTDLQSTQIQTMYAIRDGSKLAPLTPATMPSGVSLPLRRADLVEVADLSVGVPRPVAPKMGWYRDLSYDRSSPGQTSERITGNIVANEGIIAWSGDLYEANACAPEGRSRSYAVRYDTGESVLTRDNTAGAPRIAYYESSAGIARLTFVRAHGRIRLLGSDRKVAVGGVPGLFRGGVPPAARVNWREIVD